VPSRSLWASMNAKLSIFNDCPTTEVYKFCQRGSKQDFGERYAGISPANASSPQNMIQPFEILIELKDVAVVRRTKFGSSCLIFQCSHRLSR
jgi:hypothetical protein